MYDIKISVVIPTYGRPELLLRCLTALVYQDLPTDDYEVIVVNDGPDDNSLRIVARMIAPVVNSRFLKTPEKRGPAAARNMGWKNARGKLIAFTDDDTIPSVNWLSSICERYQQETLIAYSGRVAVPLPERPTDYERNTAGLENAEFVTANCCCTRAALEAVNGFDERFTTAWREDSDLQFKLMLAGIPIVKLEQTAVLHPVRKARFGVSLWEQKKGMFNALLYKKYPKLYRQKIQSRPYWNYYGMIIAGLLTLTGAVAALPWLMWPALVVWLLLLLPFIYRRLKNNSTKPAHVLEMVITSVGIPFLSVYWQLAGAVKYRVMLL